MIELRHVSKTFGKVEALRPVDLGIERGRTTILLGQSGCGKSTILRLIIGLLWPDTGEVRIDGTPVTANSIQGLRRRIGYVIQDGGLFPHLTARQNVTLAAEHFGWKADDIAARVETLAALTHLPMDTLLRFPAELSGGQRQRIGLMRALMLEPDVLLLDEPLGALDPIIRAELQNDLKEVFERFGKTVVMVTHDLAEAGFFADRIVLMRDGSVEQQGGINDLLERPASEFVTRFINAQRGPLRSLEAKP